MSNADSLYRPHSNNSFDSESQYTGRYLKIFQEQTKNSKIGSSFFSHQQKKQEPKNYTSYNLSNPILEDQNENLMYSYTTKEEKQQQIFGDLERMRNQHLKIMGMMQKQQDQEQKKMQEIEKQLKRKSIQNTLSQYDPPTFTNLNNENQLINQKQQSNTTIDLNKNQINSNKQINKQNTPQSINYQQKSIQQISSKIPSYQQRFTFAPNTHGSSNNDTFQSQFSNQYQHIQYSPHMNLKDITLSSQIPNQPPSTQFIFFDESRPKQFQLLPEQSKYEYDMRKQKTQRISYDNYQKSKQVDSKNQLLQQLQQHKYESEHIDEPQVFYGSQQTSIKTIQMGYSPMNNYELNNHDNIQRKSSENYNNSLNKFQQDYKRKQHQNQIVKSNKQNSEHKIKQYPSSHAYTQQIQYQPNNISSQPLNPNDLIKIVEQKSKVRSSIQQNSNKIFNNYQTNQYGYKTIQKVQTQQINNQQPIQQHFIYSQNQSSIKNTKVGSHVLPILRPTSSHNNQNIRHVNNFRKTLGLAHKNRLVSPSKIIIPENSPRAINNYYYNAAVDFKSKSNHNTVHVSQQDYRKRFTNLPQHQNFSVKTHHQLLRPSSSAPRLLNPIILPQQTSYIPTALLGQYTRGNAEHIFKPPLFNSPTSYQKTIFDRPLSPRTTFSPQNSFRPTSSQSRPRRLISNQFNDIVRSPSSSPYKINSVHTDRPQSIFGKRLQSGISVASRR